MSFKLPMTGNVSFYHPWFIGDVGDGLWRIYTVWSLGVMIALFRGALFQATDLFYEMEYYFHGSVEQLVVDEHQKLVGWWFYVFFFFKITIHEREIPFFTNQQKGWHGVFNTALLFKPVGEYMDASFHDEPRWVLDHTG